MATNGDPLKNKIISKVSYDLIVFADSLTPSPEYMKEGKETLQRIFDRIKADPKFSVDRIVFGGSVGKNTSVLYPDFDGVVFLNKARPPLMETVEDFRDILTNEAKAFKIIPESITWSSNTATATFENGIEMDLLPACSFSQNVGEQYQKVLEQLRKFQDMYLIYSSSLADIQTEFLRVQPGATHQLIRVVKYWYKTLTLDKSVYGGSYLMEILSVTVCHQAEKASAKATSKKAVPLFENFKNVLTLVSKIYTLKIAFIRQKGKWQLLAENEIGNHKDQFSAVILKRPRYIIDPSNPYNDLVKNLSIDESNDEIVRKLKDSATKMLKRLEMLETSDSNDYKTVTQSPSFDLKVNIEKLFEPLSLSLKERYPAGGIPKSAVIHYDYNNYTLATTKTETRSKAFFQNNKDAKKVSKAICTDLVTLLRGKARLEGVKYIFINGLVDISTKAQVKDAVGKLLNQNFPPGSVKECPSNSDHANCDVSLYIPYHFKGKIWAVRLSLKW